MVTSLGKMLRKIRIDKDENALSMAKKLGISLSYLSAIENGKRNIPDGFGDKVIASYELKDEQAEAVHRAVDESATQVTIPVAALNPGQKQLAISFARKVDNLSETEIEELLAILR